MTSPTRILLLGASLVLGTSGCTPPDEDSDIPELPDEDSPPEDTGPFDIPDDTDDGGPVDQVPLHTLNLYQDAALTVTPAGGPYTALTGELSVMEFIDYERPEPGEDTDIPADTDYDPTRPWDSLEENPLACEVVYRMIGAPAETSCGGCDFAMDIEFTVQSGDPGPCRDPDLPRNGETRRFGWRGSDNTMLYDFGGIGSWFPWYRGTLEGDTITIAWRSSVAVSVEEEDDQ